MTLGEFISDLRNNRNVSAKSISKKLGSDSSYITNIENGKIFPNKKKLNEILKILDVPDYYLPFILEANKKNFEKKGDADEDLRSEILTLVLSYLNKGEKTSTKSSPKTSRKDIALIMKGGGIKGIAYIGALEELMKYYSFNWHIGTSAGAITAILLSSGYSISEIKDILVKKNFDDFRDSKLLRALINLIFHKGLYHAESFSNWISRLIAEKIESSSDVLLNEFPKRVTIYACVKDKDALIFDSQGELKNTPASFAARCSMSIPFIFTPQKHNGYNVYDGGMRNNYPISLLLKSNPQTEFIGLYLGDPIFDRANEKKGIFSDIFKIWSEASDRENLRVHRHRTIIIDPKPITTLDLSLKEEEKEFLIESGKVAALQFLKRNNKISISDIELNRKKESLEILRKEISKGWGLKRSFRIVKSIISLN